MNSNPEPAIDPDGFASLVQLIGPDTPEIVVDILDAYLEEAASLVESITYCATSSAPDEMLRPVHSLKSSSASVGALRLSAICAELEQHLRGFGPDVDVDLYVRRIQDEHAKAQAELGNLRATYARM